MKNLIVCIALIFMGCDSSVSNESVTSEYSHTLQKVRNVVFEIDKETKRFGNLINYSSSLSSLCLFNNYNHSIYLYDVGSEELLSKIKLQKEGPNGLPRINAFVVHNKDSILILDALKRELSIVNSKGEVVFQERVSQVGESDFPMVPNLYFFDGMAYLSLLGTLATKAALKPKSLLTYNLKTGERTFTIDMPENYDGDWADKIALRYGAFIPDMNAFVSSWPMGATMKVIDLGSGDVGSFTSSSSRLRKTERFQGNRGDPQELRLYVSTNSWYQNVFYAQDQKVLLRSAVVGKAIPERKSIQENDRSQNEDNVFVITEIFNDRFEKIGEVPGTVFYGEIFSNRDGIFIADYLHDQENEDIISFAHYKLMEKKDE